MQLNRQFPMYMCWGARCTILIFTQPPQAHKLTGYDLGEYPCHPFLGSSQYYTVSKLGEFRNEYMCGEVSKSHDNGKGTVITSVNETNL